MVKLTGWILFFLACGTACTTYVDAILPASGPDAATPMNTAEQKVPVAVDESFGQAGAFVLAASANDHVADALAVADGTIYVLLRDECTVVAVGPQGTLSPRFAKGGVLRGESGCVGQSLAFDAKNERLLVVSIGNPNFIIFAYDREGGASLTLRDGDRMKVQFDTLDSLLPSPAGMRLAGTSAFMPGVAIEAFDLKGASLDRQTLATEAQPLGVLLYQTLSADVFVLAAVPTSGSPFALDLVSAPMLAFAQFGPASVTNTLAHTGSALEIVTAAKPGLNGQPLLLGEGWQKRAPTVRRPMVWAPNDKHFGEAGAALLPQHIFTTYVDLAHRGGLTAVVGTDGLEGERRTVVTVLDSFGNTEPRFVMPQLFSLPLPESSSAAKVLFPVEDTILVVGTLGPEGSASMFVSRVRLN